ncbi:MAG: hypothetical protein U9R32_11365 [Bacteroidota bacterium]|nr:hypothetical protein [Bacteroidota bacterium]
MIKKAVFTFLTLIISFASFSQDVKAKKFLILHNMLSQPDTVTFYFWQDADTLFAKKITNQFVPTREDDLKILSYKQQYGDNVITGSKLFNGKNILYRVEDEKFFISGDTLYKEITTNKLSADSLKILFQENVNPINFKKSRYQANLQIISKNRTKRKIVLFHPSLFAKSNTSKIKHKKECFDTVELIKKWEYNKTTYYYISFYSDCSISKKRHYFIFDREYNFYAFDNKYISLDLAPQAVIKPFKGSFTIR